MKLHNFENNMYKNAIKMQKELCQQSSKENSRGSHYAGGSYLMSNLMSELDIEESKEESNFHDNDSFIIQDTSKRKIDIFSSASSRLESPNSFNGQGVILGNNRPKDTSNSSIFALNQQPSIQNFKAIRNIPLRSACNSNKMKSAFAKSPLASDFEIEHPPESSWYRLKSPDGTTIKIPFENNEIGEMINTFISQENILKRPSKSRLKNKSMINQSYF